MAPKPGRRVFSCVLCCALLLSACDFRADLGDDYSAAQEAAASQDWPQTARLLQRYLRTEIDSDQRWAAWNLLLEASRNMGESLWLIDYLESMLLEFGDGDPRSGQILRQLGEVYERTRQWDRVMAIWKRVMETEDLTSGEVAAIYRRMGQIHQRNLEFSNARDMYQLCADNADDAEVLGECLYGIADTLSAEDALDDALASIDRVLGLSGVSDEVLGMACMLRGDIYEQRQEYDLARQAFQQALTVHPNPPVVETRLEALDGR